MFVLSKDEKTRKTKLERIGELAKQKKDTIFNNLGHCINLETLLETYRKMDGTKAEGIDGVTKRSYAENLSENLEKLLRRIRQGIYHPKPARIVEIPKEDGSTRPIAISCFEDKLVQQLVSRILSLIFEPLFLPCSYGFRPDHSCHEALKALRKHVGEMKDGAVVEIDIRKYFNSIPHQPLMEMLRKKISDERFLRLVEQLIRTPIQEEGKVIPNTKGCPQGSIISPVLANIYLHYVIDDWFLNTISKYMRGKIRMVRYADDMVFVFEHFEDAERFFRVLPKRLLRFGLELHLDKSKLLKSGERAAYNAEQEDRRLDTYKFLGFICYFGKSRQGRWRLKFKSRSDRLSAKLRGLKEYLRENLNTSNTGIFLERICRAIKGWVNYHAISDNSRRVKGFLDKSKWLIWKWYNRRGKKKAMTWEHLLEILERVGFPLSFKVTSMFC